MQSDAYMDKPWEKAAGQIVSTADCLFNPLSTAIRPRFLLKECVHRFRGGAGHAGDGSKLVNRGFLDPFQAAEVLEEFFFPLGADAGQKIEPGAKGGFFAESFVIRDGETVRFVAYALEEEKDR